MWRLSLPSIFSSGAEHVNLPSALRPITSHEIRHTPINQGLDSPMRIETAYPRSISLNASAMFSKLTRPLPNAASSLSSFTSSLLTAGV